MVTKRTKRKRKLRRRADKLWKRAVAKRWGETCEICGEPSGPPHHFKPKGSYGFMRYDIENGVPLCVGCHYKLEKVDPSLSVEIVKNRGEEWFDNIQERSKEDHRSFSGEGWYKENAKKLKEYLNEKNS